MDAGVLLTLLIVGTCCFSAEGGQLLEDKLKHDLLYEYNAETIPMTDPVNGDPVTVKMGLSVTAVADFKDNVLTLDTWLDYEWNDFRLAWNPSDWKGLHRISIPAKRLWVPDVVLYNSAGSEDNADHRGFRVIVNHDGSLFYVPAKRISAYCQNDDESFKASNGEYSCRLKFGSWVYNGLQVDVQNRSSDVDLSSLNPSNHWDITNTTVSRNVVSYACCPEPYIDVTFSINLRRKFNTGI